MHIFYSQGCLGSKNSIANDCFTVVVVYIIKALELLKCVGRVRTFWSFSGVCGVLPKRWHTSSRLIAAVVGAYVENNNRRGCF